MFLATPPPPRPIRENASKTHNHVHLSSTNSATNNVVINPYKKERTTLKKQLFPTQPSTQSSNTPQTTYENDSTNQSTLNTKFAPYVNLNDGTYRLTIRWKPENYLDLVSDHAAWNTCTFRIIATLFDQYKSDIWIVKWEASKENSIISIADINDASMIREYISPKITNLESTKQFVFGLRITMRNKSPSAWISDITTKSTMVQEHININISNSKCDSGDIVVAGHLLLKHPIHTHQTFYLMSLRRQLPESTPFFDISPTSTTPTGDKIYHLVVRCGANHANVLMDILSEHLDGDKNTTLFFGHKQMETMTAEEVSDVFRVHQAFLDSTQRLLLSPAIVNVDRPREETSQAGEKMARSTRDWVMTLKKPDGQSLQCDVENGGKDHKAYMIVPTEYLDVAKSELENIRPTYEGPTIQITTHRSHMNQKIAIDPPKSISPRQQ
jgi:hypothetical protein